MRIRLGSRAVGANVEWPSTQNRDFEGIKKLWRDAPRSSVQ
jgi:hypothetical protein